MLAAAIAAAGCQAVDLPILSGNVFFPQPAPHDGPTVMMAALGSGTLTLENGCLWLRYGAERDLIIWPPLYRLTMSDGRLAVLDGTGAEFAVVGDAITIGGGELTNAGGAADVNLWVESRIGESIPPPCRLGRYWDAAGGPGDVP